MANTNWSNGFKVANASTTQGPFELLGGRYGVTIIGTGFGTVQLQILSPDGTTYVVVTDNAAVTVSATANLYTVVDLPPCEVKIDIATATAVYASVIPISNRR